jgi:hypothetical protein
VRSPDAIAASNECLRPIDMQSAAPRLRVRPTSHVRFPWFARSFLPVGRRASHYRKGDHTIAPVQAADAGAHDRLRRDLIARETRDWRRAGRSHGRSRALHSFGRRTAPARRRATVFVWAPLVRKACRHPMCDASRRVDADDRAQPACCRRRSLVDRLRTRSGAFRSSRPAPGRESRGPRLGGDSNR